MAKGLITHAYLEDTADAIRVLRGESDTYTPDEFGEKIIDAIPDVTVTDSIVSVTDAAAYPAEGLEFAIEPVQDLHGYDKPWPAGGGKNLAPVGNWSGHSGTVSGMDLSIPANTQFTCSLIAQVDNAETPYYALVFVFSDNTQSIWMTKSPANTRQNFSAIYDKDIKGLMYYSDSRGWFDSQNVTLTVTDFQIELGSTATSYEPYSNICPISGWTGVNGERTGVNVWDEEWELGMIDFAQGTDVVSSTNVRSKYFRALPSTEYYVYNSGVSSSSAMVIFWYDSSKSYISYAYCGNKAVLSPNNASYARFYMGSTYGTTYNHDISINYPATDTEYHAYTGTSIPVSFPALGKNLLPTFNTAPTVAGLTITVNGGAITINGTISSTVIIKAPIGDWKWDGTVDCWLSGCPAGGSATGGYSLRISDAENSSGFSKYDTGNGIQLQEYGGASTTIINRPLCFEIVLRSGTYTNKTFLPMLNYGLSAEPYEPYTNTVYGGKVDVVRGKLTVHRVITDISTSIGSYSEDSVTVRGFITIPPIKVSDGLVNNIMCDKLKTYVPDYTYRNDIMGVSENNHPTVKGIWIRINKTLLSEISKTGMIQWIQDNNPKLAYELATPIEYDITPQQVQMLLGDNNVWCDTGNATLEYKVDLGRFIAKLQASQTPQLSLSRQAVSLDTPRDVEPITQKTDVSERKNAETDEQEEQQQGVDED